MWSEYRVYGQIRAIKVKIRIDKPKQGKHNDLT